jgi:rhamnogalacturonan endolyase
LNDKDLRKRSDATFTIQLAGAKTAAGNTDFYNATELYSDLPLNVAVNGKVPKPWVIPYVTVSRRLGNYRSDRHIL